MRRVITALGLALALSGCASADKHKDSGTSTAAGGAGSVVGAGGSGAMPGMSMGSGGAGSKAGTGTVVGANGVPKPVAIRTIAAGTWGDMRIQAQTMTPLSFQVYDGTGFRTIKATPKDSFHLMVMLTDKHTNEPIPYAAVWATITRNGKVVFDERQWPMLSEYMGPHYGNDVALPGPGSYRIKLQVSAPVAGLHPEYARMWRGAHDIYGRFSWK